MSVVVQVDAGRLQGWLAGESAREAEVREALELQDMLIDPVQRMVKRRVEREIFAPIVEQACFDPAKAQVRLNWGNPETPEITASDLIAAAEKNLIRPEEFRKNAVKFGWELWEEKSLRCSFLKSSFL